MGLRRCWIRRRTLGLRRRPAAAMYDPAARRDRATTETRRCNTTRGLFCVRRVIGDYYVSGVTLTTILPLARPFSTKSKASWVDSNGNTFSTTGRMTP